MNMKKLLAFALCLVLVSGLSIAGTIAWLTDTTEEITNTFTTSGIDITLTETKNSDGSDNTTGADWTAQLIPGKTYTKNPVVSVVRPETDVDVYLFVKMVNNASAYINFTNNLDNTDVWAKLDGVENVWYQVVEYTEGDKTVSWNLIDKDTVTVKDDLTKDTVAQEDVTITYTAYAIQTEGFDSPAKAWEEIGN